MLTELLRNLTLIQAPMAGVQGAELTLAVMQAGGLGSLPAAMLNPTALNSALTQIEQGSSSPYNVNFFCHKEEAPDEVSLSSWQTALAPYYLELGADPNAPAGPARTPFNEEALTILQKHRPAVVSFHFGLPDADLLASTKALGSMILGCATNVEEALWLQANGVDGVIAQGSEAGGHQGSFLTQAPKQLFSTQALVKAITQNVTLPVIAAGGIATRTDAKAMLRAGATAVQVGSAYLQADEATTSQVHRKALKSPLAKETVLTNVFSGRQARGIWNRLIREKGPICEIAPTFPHAASAIAPLRNLAEARGSGDFSPLWSGERGYLSESLPAAQITRKIDPRQS